MIKNTEELRDCLEDCFPMMDFGNLNYDDDREDAISQGVEKLHDYMHEPIPGQPTGSSLESERESSRVRALKSELADLETENDLMKKFIKNFTARNVFIDRNGELVVEFVRR